MKLLGGSYMKFQLAFTNILLLFWRDFVSLIPEIYDLTYGSL